jgi:hypothetical protein
MDEIEDDGNLIRIILSGVTSDREGALKVVEVFSRMMVGLALDGLDVSLDVTVLEEYEPEYEEIDEGEDES